MVKQTLEDAISKKFSAFQLTANNRQISISYSFVFNLSGQPNQNHQKVDLIFLVARRSA
jgi:hypothetical protein